MGANTFMIIDNPCKLIVSKFIAKCQISTTHNRTIVLIIGGSLPDSLVRECPELSQKSRFADTFAPFLYLSPCVVPYGNIKGWKNSLPSFTSNTSDANLKHPNVSPNNAPRGHSHTATFQTKFYLFAPPPQLKIMLNPSSEYLDSLAWTLGWTCNTPPLEHPSTWFLSQPRKLQHTPSRDLSFALIPPRENCDPCFFPGSSSGDPGNLPCSQVN